MIMMLMTKTYQVLSMEECYEGDDETTDDHDADDEDHQGLDGLTDLVQARRGVHTGVAASGTLEALEL